VLALSVGFGSIRDPLVRFFAARSDVGLHVWPRSSIFSSFGMEHTSGFAARRRRWWSSARHPSSVRNRLSLSAGLVAGTQLLALDTWLTTCVFIHIVGSEKLTAFLLTKIVVFPGRSFIFMNIVGCTFIFAMFFPLTSRRRSQPRIPRTCLPRSSEDWRPAIQPECSSLQSRRSFWDDGEHRDERDDLFWGLLTLSFQLLG